MGAADLTRSTQPPTTCSERQALPCDGRLVPRPFADELPKLLVSALHAWVVLGDVPARERKESFVARAEQLVSTRALDDATHERLLRQGR